MYVVPYLIVNAWLVTITLLQHTCAQFSSCEEKLVCNRSCAAYACPCADLLAFTLYLNIADVA